MSEDYISQFYTWATGNTITASRLNGNVSNVTDGLSGGSKAVNVGKVLVGGTEVITSGRAINVTGLTLTGDITSTGTAIDWDLQDNVASALSFDSAGKTGLLEFVTTDSAEGLKTTGFFKIVSDAASLTAVGALVLGVGGDAGLFFNGTDLTIQTDGAGASGIIFDSEDDTFEFKGSGTLQATFDTTGLNLVSGDVFKINGTSVLSNDTLGSGVVNTSITSTGALNSGSITSGFGNIDVGSSNIDGGTITADTALVGTLSTASQTNITAVGTLSTLTVSGDATFDTSTLKVDSTNNRVGIGTASPAYLLHIKSTGDASIKIEADSDNDNEDDNAYIEFSQDGGLVTGYVGYDTNTNDFTIINNHASANLTFKTDELERMRIDSSGNALIGTTSTILYDATSGSGIQLMPGGPTVIARSGSSAPLYINKTTANGDAIIFRRAGATVGEITLGTSSTSYNTSSDYRLKENVTPLIDGIARLMELRPCRFNFKKNKNQTVDGFLAHEVQKVISEAVTGEKDAVDAEGKPVFQGIDQSKIIPLLTASLQELAKKVEELENKCLK
tara:strand:+ start:12500 stop:14179 length:1680 start_codon:yes stop_codon:yes gene_type:complete